MSVNSSAAGRRSTSVSVSASGSASASDKRASFQSHEARDSFKSLHTSLEDGSSSGHGGGDGGCSEGEGGMSPRIPRKFISNWRHACDRTRDRTKELLRRWRTMPDGPGGAPGHCEDDGFTEGDVDAEGCARRPKDHGWTVHVWATWVERNTSEDETTENTEELKNCLSDTQREKFTHFFTHLLDTDRDNKISEQDFDLLSERLRHFADWSTNSPEFHILHEVQNGFVDTFIKSNLCNKRFLDTTSDDSETVSLDHWLIQWSKLVKTAQNLYDFPLWLQYFAKIIFLVMNRSGSGIISKDELRIFYSSFLGFEKKAIDEFIDLAYDNLTSNGDYKLRYSIYRLCFSNFLLGRFPHGPGQFLFGTYEGETKYSAMFPIDYSAMNSPPEALEQYSPHKKSNRHSVIV
ncbi:uncharacterized protein LOC126163063 [Schistocerca cancellata]|uniref:uncharacterized protein LOC126163063 n=1 Tax=Schistocerca cancellata TaxID=274614 RepID=UPI002118D26D|nr:uncharacterized protein LOC126163063 [Schistocerca cancellata]